MMGVGDYYHVSHATFNVLGPPAFDHHSFLFYFSIVYYLFYFSPIFFFLSLFPFSLFPFSFFLFFFQKKLTLPVFKLHVLRDISAASLGSVSTFSFKFKLSTVPSIYPTIWQILKSPQSSNRAGTFRALDKSSFAITSQLCVPHRLYLDCLVLFPLHYRLIVNIIYSRLEHRSIVISGSLNIWGSLASK